MSNGETQVEKRIRAIEHTCASHASEYKMVTETMEDHETRMRDIEKLVPALRAVMWVGSVLGASLIMFIWAMITGQVHITFP